MNGIILAKKKKYQEMWLKSKFLKVLYERKILAKVISFSYRITFFFYTIIDLWHSFPFYPQIEFIYTITV